MRLFLLPPAVGSHGQLPGGRPPSGYNSPSPATSAALLSPDRAPTGAMGPTHLPPGSLATSLASAFELAAPTPVGTADQGQGAGQLSAFAAPFTAFGSPGILARDPALVAQGEAGRLGQHCIAHHLTSSRSSSLRRRELAGASRLILLPCCTRWHIHVGLVRLALQSWVATLQSW